MNTKRLLWWIVGSLSGPLCIGLILAAYWFGWPNTGFQGKTVWDWLQLLIIPLVLALAALFFNQANSRTERQIAMQRYEQDQQIALDKQREDLLQTYLDRMSELLL
jgi:MFS family permease